MNPFSGIKTLCFEMFLNIISMVFLLIIIILWSGLKVKIGIKHSNTLKWVFPAFPKAFFFNFILFHFLCLQNYIFEN